MRIARAVGATGRMMIRVGVLLLLFVAYQLWGTGIQTTAAQRRLGTEFKAQQVAVAAGEGASTTTASTSSTVDPATVATSPASVLPPSGPSPSELPPPEPGQAIGQITIADIGAQFYIVEGVDLRWLQEGPGHFPSTALPGQAGNAALAGHRTTYKAPFNRIDELEPGANIVVETVQGTFTYEVLPQPGGPDEPPKGHFVVSPYQTEILEDKGDNRLTLMACNPKYSAAQRIVVEARLVTPAAPTTPQTTPAAENAGPAALDDLAGNDSSAWPHAFAWSALAVGIWFGAWFVGHRNRRWRWPAYAIALPLFVVVLYFSFENVARLLPASY